MVASSQKQAKKKSAGTRKTTASVLGSVKGSAPGPPAHERKFTTHSYFSSTLRDVAADNTSAYVIIPHTTTELELRKKMFEIYKDQKISTAKEYETRLCELIKRDTEIVDVKVSDFLVKRYLFLKRDILSGIVTPAKFIVDAKEVQVIRSPVIKKDQS